MNNVLLHDETVWWKQEILDWSCQFRCSDSGQNIELWFDQVHCVSHLKQSVKFLYEWVHLNRVLITLSFVTLRKTRRQLIIIKNKFMITDFRSYSTGKRKLLNWRILYNGNGGWKAHNLTLLFALIPTLLHSFWSSPRFIPSSSFTLKVTSIFHKKFSSVQLD